MTWKVSVGCHNKTLGYIGTYKSIKFCLQLYLGGKSINIPTLLNNSAQHMTDIRRANGERTSALLVLKVQICPFQQQHTGHNSVGGKGQSLKFRLQYHENDTCMQRNGYQNSFQFPSFSGVDPLMGTCRKTMCLVTLYSLHTGRQRLIHTVHVGHRFAS